MIAVERNGIELDHCISCRGLWFDRDELDLFSELTGFDLSNTGLDGEGGVRTRRVCPRCPKHLDELALGSIRIDRCPAGDGFWFDRGELGSLLERAPATSGPLEPVTRFLGEVFEVRPQAGGIQEELVE